MGKRESISLAAILAHHGKLGINNQAPINSKLTFPIKVNLLITILNQLHQMVTSTSDRTAQSYLYQKLEFSLHQGL